MLPRVEGTPQEVALAYRVRDRQLARVALHFRVSVESLLALAFAGHLPQHARAVQRLASERSAAWWLRNEGASVGVLLARATVGERPSPSSSSASASALAPASPSSGHPTVGLAVISRADDGVPRLAQ